MPNLSAETRARLDNLNNFLQAFYNQPRRMSEILRAAGLAEDDLMRLQSQHLEAYLTDLLEGIAEWLIETLPERHSLILIRRYGLDGQACLTLAALGDELGISRERVRQLQQNALNRLKGWMRKRPFERVALEIARRILGIEYADNAEKTS